MFSEKESSAHTVTRARGF